MELLVYGCLVSAIFGFGTIIGYILRGQHTNDYEIAQKVFDEYHNIPFKDKPISFVGFLREKLGRGIKWEK